MIQQTKQWDRSWNMLAFLWHFYNILVRYSEFEQLNRRSTTDTKVSFAIPICFKNEISPVVMTIAIWKQNTEQLRRSRKGYTELLWGADKGRIWERMVQKPKKPTTKDKSWDWL